MTDHNLVRAIDAICRQNQEMRLRLGVLIRVLVEKGLITTEEYAARVNEAEDAAQYITLEQPSSANPTPVAVGRPVSKRLPKPPKILPKAPGADSSA